VPTDRLRDRTTTKRHGFGDKLENALTRRRPGRLVNATLEPGRAVSWERDGVAFMKGAVEPGDRRGRELGFPTANLGCEHLDIGDGVWAGLITIEGDETRIAAISIGRRSTIYGQTGYRLAEVHVLDFTGDLYGKTVTVSLEQFFSHQQQFDSLSSLVRQLFRDVDETRRWASGLGDPALVELSDALDVAAAS
jgi:riboflavin kinase/FMN adenylyltransferase